VGLISTVNSLPTTELKMKMRAPNTSAAELEVAAVFFTSYNRFFRTRENRSETPHSVTLTKYVAK
jgi:hypothetical protein